jgi:hypothetical protein
VAVFGLNLAVYLEADPIVLIGLDLAVEGGIHASGHPLKGSLDPARPDLRKTGGVGGKTVKTLTHLLDIKRHLELAMRDSHARVVNATVSGSHIEGTEETDLEELSRHLPPLDKAVPRLARVSPRRGMDKLPRKAMKDLMEDIRDLRDLSERGATHLARFQKRIRKGRLDTGLAMELNQAGKEIQEFLVHHPLLNQYFSSTWLNLKQDTAKILSISDSRKRLSAEVERNHRALNEIRVESGRLLDRMEKQWREEGRERAGSVRFFLDSGLLDEADRECGELRVGTWEVKLMAAEILEKKGLLTEAMGLLGGAESEPGREKARISLLGSLEQSRGDLLREAEEVLASGSPVDGHLVARELDRSLPGDVEASRLRDRLVEKF